MTSTPLIATPSDAEVRPFDTLADLLDHLGRVPAGRVLVHPAPGQATEADVLAALAAPRKRLCELIDGILVEKAVGYRESLLAIRLVVWLDSFVRAHNLGLVTGADGTVRLWPGRVRIPDIAYFSWDRLPGRRVPTEPIPEIAPDLAVEVLSAGNTPAEMRLKREDYFAVGVSLIWEVSPPARTVTIYTTADAPAAVLHEADTLEGGTVLPGFTVSLRELFAELDRQG